MFVFAVEEVACPVDPPQAEDPNGLAELALIGLAHETALVVDHERVAVGEVVAVLVDMTALEPPFMYRFAVALVVVETGPQTEIWGLHVVEFEFNGLKLIHPATSSPHAYPTY